MNKITPAALACATAFSILSGGLSEGTDSRAWAQAPAHAPPAAAPAAPSGVPTDAVVSPALRAAPGTAGANYPELRNAGPTEAAPPAAAAPSAPAPEAAPPPPAPAAEHPAAPAAEHPAVPDVATSPLPPFEGGEHGGEAAAAHGGHGAGHEESVIENWWSWDYGPGKAHHNPPFGFALINFAAFLLIVSKLFGKSFKDFLRSRNTEVKKALDRAREVQQQAEKQMRELEERSRNMEAEIAELMAGFRKLAEAERQAIVQRAEAEAATLLKDAESQAQAAVAAAKRSLEQKAALLAVDLAEKLVRSRLTDDDHRRLSERYVADVESVSRRAGAPEYTGKESL